MLILVNCLQKNFSVLWGSLLWILILLGISWIHELGHSLILASNKIPITKLVLGSGPVICRFFNLIEIKPILISAGVDFEINEKFCNLKKKEKIIFFTAGATFNLLTGLLFMSPVLSDFKQFTEDIFSYFPSNFYLIKNKFFLSFVRIPLQLLDNSPYLFWGFIGCLFILAGLVNLLPIDGLDGGWVFSKLSYSSLKNLKTLEERSSLAVDIITKLSKILIVILLII